VTVHATWTNGVPGCAGREDIESGAPGGASECAQHLSVAPLRGKEIGDGPEKGIDLTRIKGVSHIRCCAPKCEPKSLVVTELYVGQR
jgi:hypothetical protein